jgi:hypothetical protein
MKLVKRRHDEGPPLLLLKWVEGQTDTVTVPRRLLVVEHTDLAAIGIAND